MDINRLQQAATVRAGQEGFTIGARQEGFGSLIGPFLERGNEYGLYIDERHLNPEGFVHGGVLASMLDYVLYRVVGRELAPGLAVPTVDMQLQYLGAVRTGDLVCGRGRVLRETRSLVFVHGELSVAGETVLAGSGVYKKVKVGAGA
ncbi:PaaI family thioesterase [Halioxenophilus sp. WMMB6]|uniref:PaaI family thioesterase n=1 Tax=Halioxenophilus sp. WMMB6 TaxID=3073815 RepID=UPI00295EDC22|nr:PaaI family thioesterase [Halioxenophilus sp. WMMB6]